MKEQDVSDKIIEGAGELFSKYAVRSVSMDDIARHLSISKKTIYQHFRDKNEIVETALLNYMDYEKKAYDEASEKAANAIEELTKFTKCMRKDFKDMNPSILYDLQKYHPNAWKIWLDFKDNFMVDRVAHNLIRGIKEGHYRAGLDPEATARIRIELMRIGFDENIFPRGKYEFRKIQLSIFDLFLNGILSDKGREIYNQTIGKLLKEEIR